MKFMKFLKNEGGSVNPVWMVFSSCVLILFTVGVVPLLNRSNPRVPSVDYALDWLNARGYTAYADPSGDFHITSGDLYTQNVYPNLDDTYDLGSPARGYANIYAGIGSISDLSVALMTVQGTTASYQMSDIDELDPIGNWRWKTSGTDIYLEKSTGINWLSDYDVMRVEVNAQGNQVVKLFQNWEPGAVGMLPLLWLEQDYLGGENALYFKVNQGAVTHVGADGVNNAMNPWVLGTAWSINATHQHFILTEDQSTSFILVDEKTRLGIGLADDDDHAEAKLYVRGEEDDIQLRIRGYSTQTNDIVQFMKSDGTELLTLDNSGNLTMNQGSLLVLGSDASISRVASSLVSVRDQVGSSKIDMEFRNWYGSGVIYIDERASADSNIASKGQIWVKNDDSLWYTSDNGTNYQLAP